MRAVSIFGAAFLAASPAAAQLPAAPSAAATELAGLLPAGQSELFARSPQSIQADVMQRMLGTWTRNGPGCELSNSECRAIAVEMAKAAVEPELDWYRRRARLFYAYRLGELMTDAEMREASRFLRTASGRKLAAALAVLAESRDDPEQWRRISERVAVELPQPRNEHAERFFEATRHLPRRAVPAPPAPPRPPQPSRPYSD